MERRVKREANLRLLYYSARTFKVDEDRVIEYSADALRCSYIEMVSANMTGDCQNKMKSITFTS